MSRVSTRRQVSAILASRRRIGLGRRDRAGRREGDVGIIAQLAGGCRAARGRREGRGSYAPSMAPPRAGPVRYVARWFAWFRPSPLKTGPSEARTTPIVNGDSSKFFVHFHTTFTTWDPNGVGGYVERQDWARRTGQGARRSRTGGWVRSGDRGMLAGT